MADRTPQAASRYGHYGELQAVSEAKRAAPMSHRHEFTALHDHFGWYGPQDAHRHVCFEEGCDVQLIGRGRACDGRLESHEEVSYD